VCGFRAINLIIDIQRDEERGAMTTAMTVPVGSPRSHRCEQMCYRETSGFFYSLWLTSGAGRADP